MVENATSAYNISTTNQLFISIVIVSLCTLKASKSCRDTGPNQTEDFAAA